MGRRELPLTLNSNEWDNDSYNDMTNSNFRRIFKTQSHATVKLKLQKNVSWKEKQILHMENSTKLYIKIPVNSQVTIRYCLVSFRPWSDNVNWNSCIK